MNVSHKEAYVASLLAELRDIHRQVAIISLEGRGASVATAIVVQLSDDTADAIERMRRLLLGDTPTLDYA